MSNVTYVQVFNFGDTNAGQTVQAQVLDSTGTPLAAYSGAGVTESGAGQYLGTFSLLPGFTGFVRGKILTGSDAGAVDTYAVSLPVPESDITPVLTSGLLVTPILTSGPVTVITPQIS